MSKLLLFVVLGSGVEVVGEDVLVLPSGGPGVIRLSGASAQTFLAIQAGQQIDPSSSAVRELLAAGVVRSAGVSRRRLIRGGAIGAGAGIAMLAMPSVAAASSADSVAPILLREEFTGFFYAYTQSPTLQDQTAVVLVSAVVTVNNGNPQDVPIVPTGQKGGLSYFGITPGALDGSTTVVFKYDPRPSGTINRLEIRFSWEGVPFWAVYTPD
jgi:hypothetical protein